MTTTDTKICFLGAGNMASALIGGLLNKGFADIYACDPNPTAIAALQKKFPQQGIQTSADNQLAADNADVIVLAVKPQVLKTVAKELAQLLGDRKPLLISIAAGITLPSLQSWLGAELPIIRCMPNTPALVGLGATGLYANPKVSPEQKALGENILSAVGLSAWLNKEEQLDAVTALSGSGPAYYFLLMEAMIAAGTNLGLDPDTATKLTLQTALGAATMANDSEELVSELRRRVTSPGGTTEQAIHSFQSNHFESIVEQALKAAADRSVSLSSELKQDN